MPVRPENKHFYETPEFKRARAQVRERSEVDQVCEHTGELYRVMRCECVGDCGLDHGGRCVEVHLRDGQRVNGRVVLSTAHVDQDPSNNRLDNLRMLCQLCHNRIDAPHRARNGASTRHRQQRQALEKAGQKSLFG